MNEMIRERLAALRGRSVCTTRVTSDFVAAFCRGSYVSRRYTRDFVEVVRNAVF